MAEKRADFILENYKYERITAAGLEQKIRQQVENEKAKAVALKEATEAEAAARTTAITTQPPMKFVDELNTENEDYDAWRLKLEEWFGR